MTTMPPIAAPPATSSGAAVSTAARALRVITMPAFSPRANPYNRLLCEGLVELGTVVEEYSWRLALTKPWDVVHLHWPEYMLQSRKAPWLSPLRRAANLAVLRLLKQRGVKLVWTIHNLKPHGLPAETVWAPYVELLELVDACIYLSNDSRGLFQDRYPAARDLPGFVIPHGVYSSVYPRGVSRDEARRRLGIPTSAKVVTAVGGIQRYKNLVNLVREHGRLDREDVWLVVAGRPSDSQLTNEIEQAAGDRPNVLLHLRFIPDDRLQDYFAAADLCVTPYSDILNSGAAMLSLSFDAPVLCPGIGSLVELQQMAGHEWVRTYEGEFDAAKLADAITWSEQPRGEHPDLSAMQWDAIGRQTLAAFQSLCSNQPR